MSVPLHFVVSEVGHKACTFFSFRSFPLEYILCFHTINRFNFLLLILDTYYYYLYFNSCNGIFHHNLNFPLISHTTYYSYIETRYFIAEELKTNLMYLLILFFFLCTQNVSEINTSIIRSLRPHWSFCSCFAVCWKFGATGFE